MQGQDSRARRPGGSQGKSSSVDLIPREFLRIIAVWSLIPSYMIAGGFIGYLMDRWLGQFPYLTCLGFLLALGLAIRDMWRLRDTM